MARILIVNDEADLVDLCAMILGERGHEMMEATSEARALELAAGCRPDLLLLDLVVPGTSGERMARALRARAGRVPLVVMSASADGPSRANAMGAEAFLAKPFGEEELVATVERVLEETGREGARG